MLGGVHLKMAGDFSEGKKMMDREWIKRPPQPLDPSVSGMLENEQTPLGKAVGEAVPSVENPAKVGDNWSFCRKIVWEATGFARALAGKRMSQERGSGENKSKKEECGAVITVDDAIKQGGICWLHSVRLGCKFKVPSGPGRVGV